MVQEPMFTRHSHCRPGRVRVVCGLDFGTVTGYAVLRIDAHGVLTTLTSGQCALPGNPGQKFDAFDSLLAELDAEYRPEHYGYEAVEWQLFRRDPTGNWAARYFGQLAVLHEHCWVLGNPEPRPVSISEVKVRVTGKGNATKAEVMRAVEGILGRAVRGDHEADAFSVGLQVGDEVA